VEGISYGMAQSDHIKWRLLYKYNINCEHVKQSTFNSELIIRYVIVVNYIFTILGQ